MSLATFLVAVGCNRQIMTKGNLETINPHGSNNQQVAVQQHSFMTTIIIINGMQTALVVVAAQKN